MITTAAILAAGVGSRLDPLTRDRPKCLVRVGGRAILRHQLDALRAAGIERVIIVVGYQEAVVRNWCRTFRGLSIDCVSNVDPEFTSNMYSALLRTGPRVLRIDHLVVSGVRVVSAEALPLAGSDHLAVAVELEDEPRRRAHSMHDRDRSSQGHAPLVMGVEVERWRA